MIILAELALDAGMIMQGLLFLLSIIGGLIMLQLKGVQTTLAILPKIEVDMAAAKANLEHHGEKLGNVDSRLANVETHVNNQERIAVMASQLLTILKEVDALREYRHWSVNLIIKMADKAGIELPPQAQPRPT